MGRGSSGIGATKVKTNGGSGSRIDNITPPPVRLYSKSQVNDLTSSFTPEQFLGKSTNWSTVVASARMLAEDNMPKSLEIGGYTFNSMGAPHASFVTDGQLKNNTVVLMDYQSNEMIGNEYPVIQIGVRLRKFRGKTQAEIIRNNPIYGTKFW